MKKKEKQSYASAAKAIIKKYTTRLGSDFSRFDKLSVDAMNSELSTLMEQQEQQKTDQVTQQYQTMARGGRLPKMWAGGYNPFMEYSYRNAMNPNTVQGYQTALHPQMFAPQTNDVVSEYPLAVGPQVQLDNYPSTNYMGYNPGLPAGVNSPETTIYNRDPNLVPKSTIQKPSQFNNYEVLNNDNRSSMPWEAIGAGIQGVGAIASALLTKKPGQIQATPVAPVDYLPPDYTPMVQSARLVAREQRRALRSGSASQIMGNNALASAQEQRAVGQIYGQQANETAQGRNQMNQFNAQMTGDYNRQKMAANEMNVRNRMWYDNQIAAVPEQLGQIGAGAIKDKLMMDMQDRMMPFLGQNNYMIVNDSRGNPVRASVPDQSRPGTYSYWDRNSKRMMFMVDGKPTASPDQYYASFTPKTKANV